MHVIIDMFKIPPEAAALWVTIGGKCPLIIDKIAIIIDFEHVNVVDNIYQEYNIIRERESIRPTPLLQCKHVADNSNS